jgi:lycopene beta-cyclase
MIDNPQSLRESEGRAHGFTFAQQLRPLRENSMVVRQNYDVIFIGGGLAAGLSALILRDKRPELKVLILEARDLSTPELPQTWSFQTLPSDIDPSQTKLFSQVKESWLGRLISRSWTGYTVRFPELSRHLDIPYHSIRSKDFWTYLKAELGPSLIFASTVTEVKGNTVTVDSGAQWKAKRIIDSRGWAKDAFPVAGYQKFVGLNLKLKVPHGLKEPILMDATVKQVDGFRFLYTLPWDDYNLLIEDTHYSDDAELDIPHYREEILAYAKAQGWAIDSVGEMEQGALALPSFSKQNFFAEKLSPGTSQLGVRAGLFHATTGYSIYDAVLGAEQLLNNIDLDSKALELNLSRYSDERWGAQEFYRRLNNMLFFAALPEKRYRVLERFYQHDSDLISRFYAGKTNGHDKFRIMSGKPPIPMKPAIYHFFNRREVQHG